MADLIPAALLVLFLAHLVAFAWLGLRRRQWYYLALVATFSLLSLSAGLRWLAPELIIADEPGYSVARRLALVAAFLSLTWTALRLKKRLLDRHGNSS